jgi:O-antigen/teichoic acid export membrane protein
MYGPTIAGFYAMANRVSQVPISIVAMSMRRVFLQKAAEVVNRNRSLLKAFSLSVVTLAAIGFMPFTIIFLFGRQILVWLLGADWVDAGAFLEVMSPWLFAVWVSVPCNPTFVVLRKQKFWLALTSILTALRLGAFGIAHAIDSQPIEALQLFVIATVLGNAITIATAVSLIRAAKINVEI